ncbi:DUF1294 domain-containing protein [Gallaecimonas xiamenensis]|nr:cold shock and DUF1294 domain-containing protein [Gallaecimonas xiamenensis]
MRYQGRLSNWNDDKGFGFVEPNGGGTRAFVHIKAFAGRGRRPQEGDLIHYRLAKDASGRYQAVAVRLVKDQGRPQGKSGGFGSALGLVFLLVMLALGLVRLLPMALAFVYLGASLLSLLLYARDKHAAQRNQWRTPENTLHLLALAGGWPGAAMAQYFFRHKSKKTAFRALFWATVLLNLGALGWLLASPRGQALLQQLPH